MKNILIIFSLITGINVFAQPIIKNLDQQVAQPNQADQAILAHYSKVYQLALGLRDTQQQATALLNMYAVNQDDKILYALSENYLNAKDYRKAFVSINSVKDSTTTEVYTTKAWIFKLAGDKVASNKFFEKVLEKDKTRNDIGFQVAVNQVEAGKLEEAKKNIANYKAQTKAEEKVNTTDGTSFYYVSLNAAWENLEGLIAFVENASDATKLAKNKDKIIAYFDKALAIEKDFVLAIQNKESILKQIKDIK